MADDGGPFVAPQETLPERTVAGLLAASACRGLEAAQTVPAARPDPRAMLG
ncbi:MAG: hypothetical protein ACM3PV_05765 [Betaproteobacteria bacterium]